MKRAIAVCLLLAVLLSMTACGERQEAAAETLQTEITEPPAEPVTEPAPTEPEFRLHSGIREDGTFNEHTLFLGDSLTYNLVEGILTRSGRLGLARYAGLCGAQLSAFTDGTVLDGANRKCYFSAEFGDMTLPEAVSAAGEDVTAVYFMFGTNFTKDGTRDDYIEVLDCILQACPNATVYLQTVPYSTAIPYRTINERVLGAFSHYQQLEEPRVLLLDACEGIGVNLCWDGVHLTDVGCEAWYQTICRFAEENRIGE